jgi:hypothetical protein
MLEDEQLGFLRSNGYVQLSGMASAETCERLIEQSWSYLPPSWDREDPASWDGAVTDSCHTSGLLYRRGHLKFQKGPLQEDPRTIAAFGPDSPIGRVAGQLFRAPPVVRDRGLYMIVPFAGSAALPRLCQPHAEAHPVQLIATTYLHDVAPGGGGLLVWPGSHEDLYPIFDSKLEFMASPAYEAILKRHRSYDPVELTGKAGDVILIHHRLLHAPSLNTGERIRFAMFSDYLSPDFVSLCRQKPASDAWEDMPGLRGHTSSPAPRPRLSDPRDWLGLSPEPDNDSTQNKRDASRLIRSLREGELWVMVSASGTLAGTNRVEPCGVDLVTKGVRALADGRKLAGSTRNDLVARIPGAACGELRVTASEQPLFLRIVRIALPIGRSRLLFEAEMPAGEAFTCFPDVTLPQRPDTRRREQLRSAAPLSEENALLKRLLAEAMLENAHLKDRIAACPACGGTND